MVLLCNAHHYNSFCLFPNKMMPISLYLHSKHASFFLISKVIVSFAEISKQILGFEETESDPVWLCDSGAKVIPLWKTCEKLKSLSPASVNCQLWPDLDGTTFPIVRSLLRLSLFIYWSNKVMSTFHLTLMFTDCVPGIRRTHTFLWSFAVCVKEHKK